MGKGWGPKKRRGTPSGEKGSTHRNVKGGGFVGGPPQTRQGAANQPSQPGVPQQSRGHPKPPTNPASPRAPQSKSKGDNDKQKQKQQENHHGPSCAGVGGTPHIGKPTCCLQPKPAGGKPRGESQKTQNTKGEGNPNTNGVGLGPHRGCAGTQPTEGTNQRASPATTNKPMVETTATTVATKRQSVITWQFQ